APPVLQARRAWRRPLEPRFPWLPWLISNSKRMLCALLSYSRTNRWRSFLHPTLDYSMSKQIKSSTNPPISQALRTTPLAVRGESTNGRVASAAGADARRRAAGYVGAPRRGEATKQTRPRRRNPEGAWVLRAIAALLVVDGVPRHRLPPRALRSPHNTHARDPLYFHHGLLEVLWLALALLPGPALG